jgi:hypothetical protein
MVAVADVEKQFAIQKQEDDGCAQFAPERYGLRDEYGARDDGARRIGDIQRSNKVLKFLSNLETRIGGTAEFEAMGIERIPEDKRQPPQILNVSYHALQSTNKPRT